MKKIRSESTSSMALARDKSGVGKGLALQRYRGGCHPESLAGCVRASQGFLSKRTSSVV